MITAVTVRASRNADRNADTPQNMKEISVFERTPRRIFVNAKSRSSRMKKMPATMNISNRMTGKFANSSALTDSG